MRRRRRPERARVLCAVLAAGVLVLSACGDEVDGAEPDDDQTVADDQGPDETGDDTPSDGDENDGAAGTVDHRDKQASDEDFAAAVERAEADGHVRVVVGLQVEFTREGAQSASANASQRDALRREQDRIVAALDGTDHTVNRRFDSVPQLALTLSPEGVRALQSSGLAASIQLDEAVPPG